MNVVYMKSKNLLSTVLIISFCLAGFSQQGSGTSAPLVLKMKISCNRNIENANMAQHYYRIAHFNVQQAWKAFFPQPGRRALPER